MTNHFILITKQVELTWDENDVDRMELNEKVNTGKINEIPDADLRKFVAYSSEEEEEANPNDSENESANDDTVDNTDESKPVKSHRKEDIISKYKNLLNDINKKEEEKKKNKIGLEFSWGIDTNKKSKTPAESEHTFNGDNVNPFEKLVEKKRDKKRARKEKIRQLKKKGQDESEDSGSEDDLPDGIDLNDSYFAEEFANGEFAPSKTKKTKSKKGSNPHEVEESSDDEAQKNLELLLDDDDHKAHFSLRKIQERENESKTSKKRRKNLKPNKDLENKKTDDDDFQLNVADSRFSAIYSSHLFNIDPTDSHYRKTKAMETLIQEKFKRKSSTNKDDSEHREPSEKRRKDVANSILVKSIKRKVQHSRSK